LSGETTRKKEKKKTREERGKRGTNKQAGGKGGGGGACCAAIAAAAASFPGSANPEQSVRIFQKITGACACAHAFSRKGRRAGTKRKSC